MEIHNDNIYENYLNSIKFSLTEGIAWQEPNEDFAHHEMLQLPWGNYLGIVSKDSIAPVPEGNFEALPFFAAAGKTEFPWRYDKLVEWDKDTKDVVWSWNVFDHFNMSDYDQFGGTWTEAYLSLHYDWTHVNAVIFDEDESDIYISKLKLYPGNAT